MRRGAARRHKAAVARRKNKTIMRIERSHNGWRAHIARNLRRWRAVARASLRRGKRRAYHHISSATSSSRISSSRRLALKQPPAFADVMFS